MAVGFGSTAGYLNHTADGRIAFGAYRARYPFGSRISDDLDRMEDVFTHARHAARVWFPMLQQVSFTHAWGGVFGVPRDRMPTMGFNPRTGVALAFGYSGEGVATANLSGRVLTDLLTETDSDLTNLPMTSHQPVPWGAGALALARGQPGAPLPLQGDRAGRAHRQVPGKAVPGGARLQPLNLVGGNA